MAPSTATSTVSTGGFLPDIAASLASAYRAAGKSPRTIEQYVGVMHAFSRHLIDLGRSDDPDDITAEDIESWITFNRATKSPVTARSYYLVLRACWSWMRRRDLATTDPFKGIDTPTADERVINILTDDEVRAIIETTAGTGFIARRDRAMLHLAADCGLRRSEMAKALLSDLDLNVGRLILRGNKANRDRVIPLSDRTRMEMRRYLKERERIVALTIQPDPLTLFVSRTGDALTVFGVHRVFAARAQQAGVEVDRPVHAWRSYFAVRALELGANESAVLAIAGWTDGAMLRRYTRGKATELALAAHKGFSPVSGL